ncbi:MAG: PorT family protein [Tannerella sp.]|jgi:hypothetical protein|nr:PorT family protein [Tannerella sp.]
MKRYFVLFLLASSCVILNAQQLKIGVRGGLNISSLSDYDHMIGQYEDAGLENKLGLYAGIFGQLHFSEKSGIETGLFYSQLGGKDKENDYYESYKITANPSYLQLPVSIFYKFNLTNGFKLYPSLGVYGGYGLSGNLKTQGSIANENLDSNIKYFNDFAKRFDAGGTAGLNLEYNKFIFGLSYDHGFIRVNKKEVIYGDNAFNSNFRCTLSYIFN